MVNAVDHLNNVKIAATVEEAVACLLAFDVDASVESDPKNYMFYHRPRTLHQSRVRRPPNPRVLLASVNTPDRKERRHRARLRRSRASPPRWIPARLSRKPACTRRRSGQPVCGQLQRLAEGLEERFSVIIGVLLCA
ncbi:hypothetical protein DIPPA_04050 [Diplonema papillatum]|nr:hypothetical protein DIPPA_04050 [Diplonema papillatum]